MRRDAEYRIACFRLAEYYRGFANSAHRTAKNFSQARRFKANIAIQNLRRIAYFYSCESETHENS